MMYLTKNFSESEFKCKCGKCKEVPNYLKENLILLCKQLEVIRFYTGPIIINSGVRCLEHNKKVGGVKDSQHLLGKAADIRVKNMDIVWLWERIMWMKKNEIVKYGYIQLYQKKGFIHIDVRGMG